MRRRRPIFRRGIISNRPLRQTRMAGLGGTRLILIEAHQLMSGGNFQAAATLFEQMIDAVQTRGNFTNLPRLYLQAGRAHLLAGQSDQGATQMRQGLELLATSGRWAVLIQAGNMVVRELNRAGKPAFADQIQEWLDQKLRDHPEVWSTAALETPQRANLPAKCPYCGGNLLPNEVEWLDDVTAECPYCGSAIQAS
jgi:uncharacterized Zn-finger protein